LGRLVGSPSRVHIPREWLKPAVLKDRVEGGKVVVHHGGGVMTLTSRMRDLRRRQRRVKKLRALKVKLRETGELKARQKLIERIHRISPGAEIPD
jgi:hypothetical protein